MRSSYTLTSENGGLTPSGNGSVYLLGGGPAGPATISNSTAAGTLTAVTDGDYLLGLNAAGTFVRKVLKSSIITTDASLLTSGTLADARLSANVPLKNAANVFTSGTQTFQTGGAAVTAVRVKDATNQTAPAVELIRSDDVVLMHLKRSSLGGFGGQISLFNSASAGETKLYGSSALYIDTGETAMLRLVPSGSDIFFQNTVSSGDVYFTGNAGAVLTGAFKFKGPTQWIDNSGSVGARVTAAREFSNPSGGYSLSEKFGAGATVSGNAGHAFGYGASAYGSSSADRRPAADCEVEQVICWTA